MKMILCASAGAMLSCAAAVAEDAFAVVEVLGTQTLLRFTTTSPTLALPVGAISGRADGETILGMDYRPFDGSLYALEDTGHLSRIDRRDAVAGDPNEGATPNVVHHASDNNFVGR